MIKGTFLNLGFGSSSAHDEAVYILNNFNRHEFGKIEKKEILLNGPGDTAFHDEPMKIAPIFPPTNRILRDAEKLSESFSTGTSTDSLLRELTSVESGYSHLRVAALKNKSKRDYNELKQKLKKLKSELTRLTTENTEESKKMCVEIERKIRQAETQMSSQKRSSQRSRINKSKSLKSGGVVGDVESENWEDESFHENEYEEDEYSPGRESQSPGNRRDSRRSRSASRGRRNSSRTAGSNGNHASVTSERAAAGSDRSVRRKSQMYRDGLRVQRKSRSSAPNGMIIYDKEKEARRKNGDGRYDPNFDKVVERVKGKAKKLRHRNKKIEKLLGSKSSSEKTTTSESSDSLGETTSTTPSTSSTSKSGLDMRTFDFEVTPTQEKIGKKSSFLTRKDTRRQAPTSSMETDEIFDNMKDMLRSELKKSGVSEEKAKSILEGFSTTAKPELIRQSSFRRGSYIARVEDSEGIDQYSSSTGGVVRDFPKEYIVEDSKETHYRKGCPLCGAVDGKIDQFDYKTWQSTQISLMKQEAMYLEDGEEKYFGFDLYIKWKSLQERLENYTQE